MLQIRKAESEDAATLAKLHADYIRESFPEHRGSTEEEIREDLLSGKQGIRVLMALKSGQPVGFLTWDHVYDSHWASSAGEINDLYVCPDKRGEGIAVALIAQMAADVRAEGGKFIRGRAYDRNSPVGHLYERLAVGHDSAECHLSSDAFEEMAKLAGLPVREIARRAPPKAWNFGKPKGDVEMGAEETDRR